MLEDRTFLIKLAVVVLLVALASSPWPPRPLSRS